MNAMKIRKRFLAASAAMLLGTNAGAAMRERRMEYIDDAVITRKVRNALLEDGRIGALAIRVETVKGTVLLSGATANAEGWSRAVELALAVPGVKGVNNDIRLK